MIKEGIIVKTIKYLDESKIIYIISNDKKDSLIVKSALKPTSHTYKYALELIKIGYEDKKSKYFTGGKIINNYSFIKSNFECLKNALKVIEITYLLSDHINDYKIFYNFLNEILDLMNQGYDSYLLELIYRTKLLYLLGIAPVLSKCVKCNKKETLVGFSFFDGGMKCKDCYDDKTVVVSNQTINTFRLLYLQKMEQLKENLNIINYSYEDLDYFLNLYYEHFIGFRSKVAQIIKKIE